MSRTALMTVGLVLILVGVQINLVESLVLSTRATSFWNERFKDPYVTMPSGTSGIVPNFNPGNYSTGNGNYAPNRFRQYSRSYARNNYPFNTPSYTTPQYNAQTPAYPAGYSGGPTAKQENNFASNSYIGPQKMITAPPWLCWPVIFFGAVTFLYGAALGRG